MRSLDRQGKLYVAFKEPEVKKLVDDIERAKSSIQFAYMMYCQSWAMRESDSRAVIAAAHQAQLAEHTRQLDQIYISNNQVSQQVGLLVSAVASGSRSASSEPFTDNRRVSQDCRSSTQSGTMASRTSKRQDKTRWRLRLALPFSTRAWDIAVEMGGSLIVHIQPLSVRPWNAPPFEYLRTGNITEVERCLTTGQLSVWDETEFGANVLQLAAGSLNTELVAMLMRGTPHLHDSWTLARVFMSAVMHLDPFSAVGAVSSTFVDLLLLCIDHGMEVGFDTPPYKHIFSDALVSTVLSRSPMRFDYDACVELAVRNQPLPTMTLSFEQRFEVTMQSSWPLSRFLSFITQDGDTGRCATHRDMGGRTALHWLARQWASAIWVYRYTENSAHIHTEHRDFMLKLLVMGAGPSTLSDAGDSPLQTVLAAFVEVLHPRLHDLHIMLGHWSYAILASGQDLGNYIIVEQSHYKPGQVFLRNSEHTYIAIDSVHHDSLGSCIALGYNIYTVVKINELSEMPGSFPRHESMPRYIIWNPTADECREVHWSTVRERRLHGPAKILTDRYEEPILLRRVQRDGHGPTFLIVGLDDAREYPPSLRSSGRVLARRATSVPVVGTTMRVPIEAPD